MHFDGFGDGCARFFECIRTNPDAGQIGWVRSPSTFIVAFKNYGILHAK